MDNGNRIDQVLSRSEAASILQSVDYDLWLIERTIKEKYVEDLTQTSKVKGGKFLDDSNLPLIFIRELE